MTDNGPSEPHTQPYGAGPAGPPYGGPPAYGPPGGGGPFGPPPGGSPKGFFGALFDFSFSSFITPMIVKAVYVLAVVVLGLTWLVLLLVTFADNPAGGLIVLILGPVVALIYLAFIRMTLEFYLAIVRMSQDIHQRTSV